VDQEVQEAAWLAAGPDADLLHVQNKLLKTLSKRNHLSNFIVS
jgi:hypothetical protein